MYDSRLCFINFQLAVYKAETVCRGTAVELTRLHPLFIAPAHIFRYGYAFLLCRHAGKSNDHFAVHHRCVDGVLLKVHADTDFGKHPEGSEEFFGVAGKPRYRFDDNAVDQPFLTVTHEAVKIVPFLHAGSCDAFIRINVYQLVLRIPLCVFCIILNLGSKGMQLIFGIT